MSKLTKEINYPFEDMKEIKHLVKDVIKNLKIEIKRLEYLYNNIDV